MPIDFICSFEEKKKKQTDKHTQNLISFSSVLDGACHIDPVVSSVPSKYTIRRSYCVCASAREYYTIHGGLRFKTNRRRMKEKKQSISYKMFSIPNAKENTDKKLHILINWYHRFARRLYSITPDSRFDGCSPELWYIEILSTPLRLCFKLSRCYVKHNTHTQYGTTCSLNVYAVGINATSKQMDVKSFSDFLHEGIVHTDCMHTLYE